eukprot:403360942
MKQQQYSKSIASSKLTCIVIFAVLLVPYLIQSSEITDYINKCSLCVYNGNQFCNRRCYTKGDACNQTNGALTYLDSCTENRSNNTLCNKLHIITSNDIRELNLLEFSMKPGEWCQFMLNDDIYNKLLKYTIANWSMNSNNSVGIGFLETNTTKKLTTDYTVNIDVSSYMTPFEPTTNMIFNFSHVVLAINYNNEAADKSRLFSMTYQSAIFGMALTMMGFIISFSTIILS